ncbi:hypothetical protein BKA93DRAFT_178631 [Sparassis latifolia]
MHRRLLPKMYIDCHILRCNSQTEGVKRDERRMINGEAAEKSDEASGQRRSPWLRLLVRLHDGQAIGYKQCTAYLCKNKRMRLSGGSHGDKRDTRRWKRGRAWCYPKEAVDIFVATPNPMRQASWAICGLAVRFQARPCITASCLLVFAPPSSTDTLPRPSSPTRTTPCSLFPT